MRSVKISAPAIQDERNGRTGAFVLCRPQRQYKRLYPAPFDVSADNISEGPPRFEGIETTQRDPNYQRQDH